MDFGGGCLCLKPNSIITASPSVSSWKSHAPFQQVPFSHWDLLDPWAETTGPAQANAFDLFRSIRAPHQGCFVWFLLLNKEKSHHRGFQPLGWDMIFLENFAFEIQSPLQSRVDIPTISKQEMPLPHYCWLRSSFKSFSWNNNKIFIKLCIWTMSRQPQQPSVL